MVDADTRALHAEKRMYASEREINFRQLSTLLATTSRRSLTAKDRAPQQIEASISALAEFAEIAHGLLDPSWVLDPLNRKILGRKGFPLEDYQAIAGTSETGELLEDIRFVSKFVGGRGDLQGFTALRMNPRKAAHAVDEQSPGTLWYNISLYVFIDPFSSHIHRTIQASSDPRIFRYIQCTSRNVRYQSQPSEISNVLLAPQEGIVASPRWVSDGISRSATVSKKGSKGSNRKPTQGDWNSQW